MLDQSTLDQIVKVAAHKKYIYGAVFNVSSGDGHINLVSAAGNIQADSQYYIASINKLFVSALILRLCTKNKLSLEGKIAEYLSEELMRGLHVYKGREYSGQLTIRHLLSQTSGLPCYLIDKQKNGKKAMTELEAGLDQAWPIEKVIREVKGMKPHFPPGMAGKARYGDTNHQILGLIYEHITGDAINIALMSLFDELGMDQTYVFGTPEVSQFVPIRYKSREIELPLFLRSTLNDIISTARDQMTFLKAFFGGHFYPKESLSELQQWNPIFFPFQYGVGIQMFSMSRLFSPFQRIPLMIGHSGSVGSVAFYVPEHDLYMTGTVNQQAKPSVAFQSMIKIVMKSQSR